MDNKKSQLKFLFWNSRSIRQRKNELPEILRNIDVFICVESWLMPKDRFEISGFSTLRKDRQNDTRGGGILFLVRKNLTYTELKLPGTQTPNAELAGLCITNTDPQINLVACYRPPGQILSQTEWDSIVNSIDDSSNSILLGDFNSLNKKWNCNSTDTNGVRLDYSIESKNLFLHNTQTSTHINMSNGSKSNLDLVFSSLLIADKINIEICDETFGSDHFPDIYHKQTFKLKSVRTNWNQFQNQLELDFNRFLNYEYDQLSPVNKYKLFISTITNSIKIATPKKSSNLRKQVHNPVAWWDDDCNKTKRLRRDSLNKWQHTLNLEDLIEYNKNCSIAKKLFKEKKIEYYKKFAQSINFRTSQPYVWETMKILKNKWVKKKSESSFNREKFANNCNACINKLSPPWVSTDYNYIPPCQQNDIFDRFFSFAEFNSILDSRKITSSPGLDGIDYEMLQKLPIKYKLLLLDIFNEMYLTGEYPPDWQHSFVHMIDKPDKNSVRPIALTSCVSKMFESLIKASWF